MARRLLAVARTLEVGELRISARTAEKLRDIHGLDPEKVRDAIEGVGGLPFAWTEDGRGLRARLVVEIDGEPIRIVLYPAIGCAATVWNLGSAFPD